MQPLPDKIHGPPRGNQDVARDRTNDIRGYVDKALEHLEASRPESVPALMRAAHVRQADDYLDAIIRFAHCAKQQLRIAHCPQIDVSPQASVTEAT